MKNLIAVTIVLASALAGISASAATVGHDSSWAEIKAAGYKPLYPKVQFGTTFVSVDGVCVDGETLRTTFPVILCTETRNDEAGTCLKQEALILSTPMTYEYEACAGYGEHCRWERRTGRHALTYIVDVTRWKNENHVFYKNFDLPACGQ